jgi:hypothetical protein
MFFTVPIYEVTRGLILGTKQSVRSCCIVPYSAYTLYTVASTRVVYWRLYIHCSALLLKAKGEGEGD